ncbi:hypothetical protein AGLY_012053 [Aphis glycines]|uniref:Uncharacterized protein n=1 Tax=Aphis glycines TaxID=307491 RepID=A0A6G0T9X2_APHGL|nr:hypothetical protein AGLY_012053 [Aphis glycines]
MTKVCNMYNKSYYRLMIISDKIITSMYVCKYMIDASPNKSKKVKSQTQKVIRLSSVPRVHNRIARSNSGYTLINYLELPIYVQMLHRQVSTGQLHMHSPPSHALHFNTYSMLCNKIKRATLLRFLKKKITLCLLQEQNIERILTNYYNACGRLVDNISKIKTKNILYYLYCMYTQTLCYMSVSHCRSFVIDILSAVDRCSEACFFGVLDAYRLFFCFPY